MKRFGLAGAALALLFSGGALAQDGGGEETQETPTEATDVASLPTADELFEKHIEAIGGREAIFAQTSRRIRGVYAGPPFGEVPARVTIWQDAPDRFHMRLAQPAGGSMDVAYDGATGWRQNSGQSPVETTGPDLVELQQTADFFGEANYKERYETRRTKGTATFAGLDVYVVSVLMTDGREMYIMFDQASGLFTGTRSSFVDPNGAKREMISIISDYEEAGGVLYPRRIEQLIGGLEKRISYNYRSVVVDGEDDGHDYSMPIGG